MPKETFFNIPPERRERVLECAVAEFAACGFEGASISRIVAASAIAKGSFYQYFYDKEDLYEYIIDDFIAAVKISAVQQMLKHIDDYSFPEFIRKIGVFQFTEFYKKPQLLRLGLDMLKAPHGPVMQNLTQKYGALSKEIYHRMITRKKQTGEIHPDVDEAALTNILIGVFNTTNVWFYNSDISLDETLQLFNDYMDKLGFILCNGILQNAEGGVDNAGSGKRKKENIAGRRPEKGLHSRRGDGAGAQGGQL